jgi:hypothetical protein
MNDRAKKYAKILYFKDKKLTNLARKTAESRSDKHRKDPDKHYPYNCVSKYFPAVKANREIVMNLELPSGYLVGESWAALKKCWIGYKCAKRQEDDLAMREYATRIQKIETELGIPTASFPNLGMIGDIFFLYDKDKETELRQKYMHENVVCDKFDVENVSQLVEEGKAIMFENKLEMKRYEEQQCYERFCQVMDEWAASDSHQELMKAKQRRWDYREKIKKELRQAEDELRHLRKEMHRKDIKFTKEQIVQRNQRKEYLKQQKILKESEIASITAVEVVKTDSGWKYVKEIIQDDYRRRKLYNHVPKYYLTDLAGHRLADYKEEVDKGYINDPYFYKLYLEDKEWEKIYSKELEV